MTAVPGKKKDDPTIATAMIAKPICAVFEGTANLDTFVRALHGLGRRVDVIPIAPETSAINICFSGTAVARVTYRHSGPNKAKAGMDIAFGRYQLPQWANTRPDSGTERQDSRLKISRRKLERTVKRAYLFNQTNESFVAELAKHELFLERGQKCLIVVRSRKDKSAHSFKNLIGKHLTEQHLIDRFGSAFINGLPVAAKTAKMGSKAARASIAKNEAKRVDAIAKRKVFETNLEIQKRNEKPDPYIGRNTLSIQHQVSLFPVKDEIFLRHPVPAPTLKWEPVAAVVPAISEILAEFEARIAGARPDEINGLMAERETRIRAAWAKHRAEQQMLSAQEEKAIGDAIARRKRADMDMGGR